MSGGSRMERHGCGAALQGTACAGSLTVCKKRQHVAHSHTGWQITRQAGTAEQAQSRRELLAV